MRKYLKQCNITYSCLTVYKYVKELGLRSIVRRKKPEYVKGTVNKVFPNLLNQISRRIYRINYGSPILHICLKKMERCAITAP